MTVAVELLSQNAYARKRGVRLAAVQHAIKSGRIELVDGKIDPEAADAAWAQNTDPDQSIRGSQNGTVKSGDKPDLWAAKTQFEMARAQLAELDLAERQGELVSAAEVSEALGTKIRGVRDSLLLLPDRLAAILAAETDAHKVRARLGLEIRSVLESLTQ